MFYALSWLAVFSLLALWSLAAWALHAAAVWAVSNAGALSGAVSAAGDITVPAGLPGWVPAELVQVLTRFAEGLAPVVSGVLQAAPALAGGLTVVTWVAWAIGGLLLLVMGAALHLVIAMWRRRGAGSAGPGANASLAQG